MAIEVKPNKKITTGWEGYMSKPKPWNFAFNLFDMGTAFETHFREGGAGKYLVDPYLTPEAYKPALISPHLLSLELDLDNAHSGVIRRVAFSGRGMMHSVGDDNVLRSWLDLQLSSSGIRIARELVLPSYVWGSTLQVLSEDKFAAICNAPGGNRKQLTFIDASGGIKSVGQDSEFTWQIARTADGELITATHDFKFQKWDPDTYQPINELQLVEPTLEGGVLYGFGFLPSGEIVTRGENMDIFLWDPATGKRTGVLGDSRLATEMMVHPSGTIIISMQSIHGGFIRGYDTKNGTILGEKNGLMKVHSPYLNLLPNNNVLVSTTPGVHFELDPQSGDQINSFYAPCRGDSGFNLVSYVETLPDGRILAGGNDGDIRIWRLPQSH